MTHGLNLTIPIKQDRDTLAALEELKRIFPTQVQPLIQQALAKSKLVHFARVLVIDNKYIQVITEYEGTHQNYTEFFRRELTPVFAKIFALAEGAPDVNDPNAFWEYSKGRQIRSLGNAADGSTDYDGNLAGWLFSAYNYATVEEIQTALAKG